MAFYPPNSEQFPTLFCHTMKLLAPLLFTTATLALLAPPAPPAPTGLMCELLAMPERAEITDPQPEFGWIVNSHRSDDLQTAYRIQVAAAAEELGQGKNLLWDSRKVRSDQSVAVEYAGRELASGRSYWWRVRTWDRGGRESDWSRPQQFRTGRLRLPGAPVSHLDERITAVRYPLEKTEVAPVRVVDKGAGTYFLDFGRAAFAGLRLTLSSPEAGRRVLVHLGEALDGPERVHRKPGGSIRYARVELTLKEGRHTYPVPLEARDARRMPPEIGPVMPFRYVEVENAPAPLDRDAARQVAVHYPFNDAAARFTSSDPRLDAVWDLCRYTIKATTFCGVYVDGDRERLPYEADAYINQLGHYAADREYSLARYTHEYLILHPTWPTEWFFHSVFMAWEDYWQTGDKESLEAFYEDLKAKTLLSLADDSGLISTVQPRVPKTVLDSVYAKRMQDIVDWPAAERDGYEMRPYNTVVNAFHLKALERMTDIAGILGKKQDEERLQAALIRAGGRFHSAFFSYQTGLFVDGEGSAHSSLHANMFPLAFGLAPVGKEQKIREFIRSKGMACSVYGAQYLMEALYQSGMGDQARALITAPGDRSWAHMLFDVGSTMTLEAWDNKYKPNQDWNHAWGAAPANVIPRLLMGVEPTGPGFRTLRIRPQPGGLESASLDLPTIRGTVGVRFEKRPGQFRLETRLPANATADVYLPRPPQEAGAVTVDGKPRAAKEAGAWVEVSGIGSGRHVLEWNRKAR